MVPTHFSFFIIVRVHNMFTNRFYSPFLLLGLSSICTSVFAEQTHQHEFIQHEAHIHGLVTFNIVQDGNELLVEINSPGNDVLGFEHQPKTDERSKAIPTSDPFTQATKEHLTFT